MIKSRHRRAFKEGKFNSVPDDILKRLEAEKPLVVEHKKKAKKTKKLVVEPVDFETSDVE